MTYMHYLILRRPGLEILRLIRLDRAARTIHQVVSFEKNEFGFYNVNVDMEGQFLGTKVLHVKATLPYPMLEFDKLNSVDQFKWMWRYG